MGIYSRDYLRDDRRGWSPSAWGTPGCKWIIVANVVVFVLQLLSRSENASLVTQLLSLSPERVLHGEVWRLVTYSFCHETEGGFPWHIVFNMLFIAWWGTTLERMFGTREFVLFYLAAACVSGLAFLGLSFLLGDPTPAIGASGAVMAILAVYAILFPREEIYLLLFVRIQIRFFVLGYLIYDLLPVLQSLGGNPHRDGVAHAAHLGGLAFGFIYHRYGLKIERLTSGIPSLFQKRSWIRPKHVKIYQPREEAPQTFDLKVDAILDKIHAHGEASLTDQEREILRKASERYKSQRQS